jgi:hypothetical protein
MDARKFQIKTLPNLADGLGNREVRLEREQNEAAFGRVAAPEFFFACNL